MTIKRYFLITCLRIIRHVKQIVIGDGKMDILKIKKAYPNAIPGIIEKLAEELDKEPWEDENKLIFLAQCAHESGGFRFVVENLNYSLEGLKRVFPKYFVYTYVPRNPLDYVRRPEKIANVVYANRMGNGDEYSGDGWKYRGRGLIQLTGKRNYTLAMQALDVTDPDYFSTVEGAVKSAIWFWKINMLSRERDLAVTTKRINGGLNGLDSRKAHLNAIKKAIFEKPKKDTINAN